LTLAVEQPEVIQTMNATLKAIPARRQAPTGPAIENKPLVGAEINIKLSLSPGMVTLVAAPVAVLVTMLAGWLVLKTVGMPVYAGEMVAAAIVNIVGGVFAALPLFILMKRGAQAIAQAGILGIAMRVGAIMLGLMMAGAPAWGLSKMPLVYWVMGFYFPLLMVETGVVAWLSMKAKH
jgi:hypothetical protein